MKTIQAMKQAKRVMTGVIASVLLGMAASAQTTAFVGVTSNPVNPNGVSLRGGSIPPQPGVELFVFNPLDSVPPGPMPEPPYGTTYTLTFKASEQPASLVAIPGKVLSYTYTTGDSGDSSFPDTLKIEFRHERYAGGVEAELPGPVSDFAIAIIPTDHPWTPTGVPSSLRGSYMATNISPLSWRIIPPSPTNFTFGFEVTGNNGQTAFFDLFVPDGLLSSWSALLGRPLSQDDLALFSDSYQASTRFETIAGTNPGALVEILLTFNPTSNLVIDLIDDEPSEAEGAASAFPSPKSGVQPKLAPPGQKVTKRLTVGEAPALSLLTTRRTVPVRRRVTLYGWAKYGTIGQTVSLKQQYLGAPPKPKPVPMKRLRLDADGKFVTSVRMLNTSRFTATHRSATGILSRSKPLNVAVPRVRPRNRRD
jgi:hypothetical protein